MNYDKKDKTVYLISGSQWGWDENIEKEFKKFTKDMINHAKEEFQKRFEEKMFFNYFETISFYKE